MAFTSGLFDAPGGTIELSNLGGDQKIKNTPGAFESRYSNFRGGKKHKQTQWKPWIFVGAWVFGAKHNSICSFFKVSRWAGSRTSFWSGQQGTRQWSHGYDDGDYHFWGCFTLPASIPRVQHEDSLSQSDHCHHLPSGQTFSFTTCFFFEPFSPLCTFSKMTKYRITPLLEILSLLPWKANGSLHEDAFLHFGMPGVCRIPEGAKLFTAQRFDEYDGVSWMVHTDGNQEREK